MTVELWPITGRAKLVQAFRPGEPAAREAPFRTLRIHHWASGGVGVVTRKGRHATGRVTVFSALNLDAARCAREGQTRAATALAKAASRVEKSASFARMTRLMASRSADEVTAVVEGGLRESDWPELLEVLRLVARETREVRAAHARTPRSAEVLLGRIASATHDVLVLEGASGRKTYVPRWLAHTAHRDQVGDLLGLVTERLDDQLVVRAVPALQSTALARTTSSPFGRAAAVRDLTAKDVQLLAGMPAPLRIVVPVTIER